VDRVKVYVDGFNLYHGLKAKHGRKYLWLDLQELAVRLLKPSQHLVGVEYFTARVRNQPAAEERQSVYTVTGLGFVSEYSHETFAEGGWLTPGAYDNLSDGFTHHIGLITLRPGGRAGCGVAPIAADRQGGGRSA
jgi:hypothetical protein